MRVAEDVSPLELRTIAGGAAGAAPPADPATCPDASAPRLVSTRASQLRDDLGEVLHYTLLASGDIIRLRRAQDTLDGTARRSPARAGPSTAALTPTRC